MLDWPLECREAFQSLKTKLSCAPALAYPEFNLPFILYVDASIDGYGAALHQAFPTKGKQQTAMLISIPDQKDWINEQRTDKIFGPVIQKMQANGPTKESAYRMMEGILTFNGRICIPASRMKNVLYDAHDALGHFGFAKTIQNIA